MKRENLLKKTVKYSIVLGVILLSLLIIAISTISIGAYLEYRSHWNISVQEEKFTETSKALNNPNRGFYSMYGFPISDSEQNYYQQLGQKMYNDFEALSLIQINLREYKNRELTEEALNNIDALFDALKAQDKQYIIRFLYDWNGKAKETEPDSVYTILEHMRQLEYILDKYSEIIFVLQGIFVGDCGEMHGSIHLGETSRILLMQQFHEVAPLDVFLSVRTPQQWRMLTGISENKDFLKNELSRRLGLFNDGIMGTAFDTGTYGDTPKEQSGPYGKWTREEELAFQEELCKYVPNGGEVIIENPVNDFENAVDSLATMHITYLNRAYDQNVLNKWADSIVTEEGCFYGMDGLSYIERHLGYRLLINDVVLDYDFWPDKLHINVKLQNVGFAPLYKEPEAYFVLQNRDTKVLITYPIETKVCSLSGGNNTQLLLPVEKEVSLAGFEAGEYEVFFYLKDTDSERIIEFANEQEKQEQGYFLGSITVGELRNPFNGEGLEFGEKVGIFLKSMAENYQKEEE